jgi:hypothetical protein
MGLSTSERNLRVTCGNPHTQSVYDKFNTRSLSGSERRAFATECPQQFIRIVSSSSIYVMSSTGCFWIQWPSAKSSRHLQVLSVWCSVLLQRCCCSQEHIQSPHIAPSAYIFSHPITSRHLAPWAAYNTRRRDCEARPLHRRSRRPCGLSC